ncbi:34766_t:CDS:1, partial [Racocetra persica]
FVKKQGFRKFVNGILPEFTISADTIKRDIMKAYDKRKAIIKAILQNAEGKISHNPK